MKKKLLALITTLIMVLTMVGCNAQGTELLKQMEKVSAWEASSTKGNYTFSFAMEGQNVKLDTDYEAYVNSKDLQIEMTLNLKKAEMNGVTVDLTKDPYKLSPVKFYFDGNTMKYYVSTSVIKDICKFAGASVADIKEVDLSKEYIGFDLSGAMTKEYLEQLKKHNKADFSILLNSKVELPVSKKDNTYNVALNGDQMVEAFFGLVNETFKTNKDLLMTTYKQMGLTEQQIKEAFEQVPVVYSDANKAIVKKALTGSAAKVNYTFSDQKYTEEVVAQIKVAVEGQKAKVNIAGKTEVNKAEVKAVNFPTSAKLYTMNDLMAAEKAELAKEVPATATTTPAATPAPAK